VYNVAGGRSYVAKLIDDAGGNYLWSDNTETGTAAIDLESAITRASDADVWINGGLWNSLASVIADDPRFAEFKPYRTGQIWLYNRRLNESGSNDYWSQGITRPDLILADLIKIFHPALAADHEFQWYKQVPASIPE
jgi:iron complex transport system substrate-binding protein